MTIGDAIFRCSSLALFCALLAGCQPSRQNDYPNTYSPPPLYSLPPLYSPSPLYSPRPLYSPPSPIPLCGDVDSDQCNPDAVKNCELLATVGNVDAMLRLGKLYRGAFRACEQYKDGPKAVDMLSRANDKGSSEALQELFSLYYLGGVVSKNVPLSEKFLQDGVKKGYYWALVANIYKKDERSDPSAMADLLVSAINGNCHSQELAAMVYVLGQFPLSSVRNEKYEKNLSKAYFWFSLAGSTSATVKGKKYWDDFGLYATQCPQEKNVWRLREIEEEIGPRLAAEIRYAATEWRVGSLEPDFRAPKISGPSRSLPPKIAAPAPSASEARPPKPSAKAVPPSQADLGLSTKPSKTTAWSWTPISLPPLSAAGGPMLDGAAVFEKVNKSVWRVIAAKSLNDFRKGGRMVQGSAVAVTRDTLLTNCHVASGMTVIVVKHGDVFEEATVISGSHKRDLCVLKISKQVLDPITGVRSYDSLKVGEKVYTVGSPSGLENTLGEGIVSGLRKEGGQRLVQTSAPISSGSSGGGLFDASGNVIGITTFLLRDAQALNFAIAVEEFGQ